MEASPPRPPETPPVWPRSAQFAFVFLLGVVATAILGRFTPLFERSRPTLHSPVVGVDLNTAEKAELMQLPHVSDKRADQIIATRERRGGFERVEDLRAVKGIGPAREAELRPWVRTATDEEYIRPTTTETSRSNKEPPKAAIDVNRAGIDELLKLPGVGKVIAGRIIAERDKAPFRRVEDLDRVAGIGPKTLEKLRPFVRVE